MNEKREYVEFLENVSEEIGKRYAGRVSGEITSTVKNNGVIMQGLLLKEEGEHVAPNFYLDQMFYDWKNGRRTLAEICEEICSSFEKEKQKNKHLLSEISFCWEEFQKNVYMRLVNRDRNAEQLEELPYKEFLDMVIVYYYSVTISDDVVGTMIIKKEHLELLQITEEELHNTAMRNTRVFRPTCFMRMQDIISKFMDTSELPLWQENSNMMYVLSNTSHMFGAVALLFEDELKKFSDRIGRGFYILPSSIHEVILVPEQEYMEPDYFAAIVRETNRTHVQVTEILSDSVYYFDRNTTAVRRIR